MNISSYFFSGAVAAMLVMPSTGMAQTQISCAAADSLAASILANDPERAAAIHTMQASVLDEKSINRLPDPEFSFDHFWGHRDIGRKYTLGISQAFDWPGLYGMRSRAASAREEAAHASQQAYDIDRMLSIHQLLADYAYAWECNRKAQLDHKLFSRLEERTAEAARMGQSTVIDLNKVRLMLLSASRRARQAQSDLAQALTQLTAANGGLPVDTTLLNKMKMTQPQLHDLDYYITAAANSQSAHALKATAEAEREQARIARKSARLPGFSLGYAYNNEMGESFHGISGSVSLPVYSSRSAIGASQSRYLAAVEASRAATESAEATVRDLYARALLIADEVETYRATLDTNEYEQLLSESFAAGLITELDYLREIESYTALMREYIDSRYQYLSAVIALSKAAGCPIYGQ